VWQTAQYWTLLRLPPWNPPRLRLRSARDAAELAVARLAVALAAMSREKSVRVTVAAVAGMKS
jgi:hypothetical protein